VRIGYFLSCEEYSPRDLLKQAQLAEQAGFTGLWISDHYHPWNHEQGQSPFVWSMIGALSHVCSLPVMTAVTCPTVRTHPAVVAQAAATSAVLTGGRFVLGVGSGEALNEHITGAPWPSAQVRLEMLEEAVEVMRALWRGEVVEHHGRHYTVEHAQLFTLPRTPPQVYVSGFGERSIELAARIGDGFVSVQPDADAVTRFRDSGGAGKPVVGGAKGCWAATRDEGLEIAHRLWANEGLPGELAQVLPTPEHFEQASSLVPKEKMAMPCGPDPQPYRELVDSFRTAGYDSLHVSAVGPHYRELIELFAKEILPDAEVS
jgi:G6PDH family F420-dependent oxidoreductase